MTHAADILIDGGYVLTMDARNTVIDNGAVVIRGDRLVDIGPSEVIRDRYACAKTIDANGKIVMPGLIDAHAHGGHGMIKTVGENLPTRTWFELADFIYFRSTSEAFWAAEARLSALERLKFGTTCCVSMLGSAPRSDRAVFADAHMAAALEVGGHNIVGIGPARPPWPKLYSEWEGSERRDYWSSLDDNYATVESVIRRWHGRHNGLAGVCVAASRLAPASNETNAETMSYFADQARRMRRLADEYGVCLTGHASAGVGGMTISGQDAMALCDPLLYGPFLIVAHGLGLSAETIGKLRDAGASVAHCPSARVHYNTRCPVIELLEEGVTVAIATDASASDRTFDLFKDVKVAMILQRTHFHDASVLPPGKALKMITIDAAHALGLGDEIGSLESGKRADVILIDLQQPHLYPPFMRPQRVAYEVTGHDVSTVIVAGRICMENRKVLTINETSVLDEVRREAELMVERSGIAPLLSTPDRFWDGARY